MFKQLKTLIALALILIISSVAVLAGTQANSSDPGIQINQGPSQLTQQAELIFIDKVNHINIKEIEITNTSDQDTSIMVMQTLKTPFTYKGAGRVKLAAKQTKTLKFKFHSLFEGAFSAKVELLDENTKIKTPLYLKAYTENFIPYPIHIESDQIDFGRVQTNSQQQAQLKLQNLSILTQELQLSSDNPNISFPEYISVPAESSYTLNIDLNTDQAQDIQAILSLQLINSETPSDSLSVNISAKVIAKPEVKTAILNIAKTQLSFNTPVGQETMQTIRIKNLGNAPLKLSAKSNDNKQVRISLPKTLKANQSADLKITYAPEFNQTQTSNIQITSNDPKQELINIKLNLQSYGGDKSFAKAQIKFDKKEYRATLQSRLRSKITSDQDAFVSLQIKQNGQVIQNLGNYELKANQAREIIWNGKNMHGEFVNNGQYLIVAQGLNENENFTRSAKIIANFGKPSYTNTNTLAEVLFVNQEFHKGLSKQIHLASLKTQCTGKVRLDITLYDSQNNYKLKVPKQKCNQILHLNIPDFLEEGSYQYKIRIQKNQLVQTISNTLKVRDVNQAIYDQSLQMQNLETGPALNAFLSQNIANTQQDIYVSFSNSQHGYLNASISGKNYQGTHYLSQFKPFLPGMHEQALRIKKNTFQPGIYTLKMDFVQGSVKSSQTIDFIIIDQKPQQNRTYGFLDDFNNQQCGEFTDINQNEQFCQKVQFANEQNLISANKKYYPNQQLQRAEAAALTIRLLGIQPRGYSKVLDTNLGYKDLDINAWYMPYMKMIIKSNTVNQAQNSEFVRRILQGYADQTMRPSQSINRAEFYKIFFEAAKNSQTVSLNLNIDYNTEIAPFSDTPINKETRWYLPYAEIIKENLNGTSFARLYFKSQDLNSPFAKFQANKKITRKEVVDLIYVLAEKNLINF